MKKLCFILILIVAGTFSSCQRQGLVGQGFETSTSPMGIPDVPVMNPDVDNAENNQDSDQNSEGSNDSGNSQQGNSNGGTFVSGYFSSSLLNKVMKTKDHANVLPYWHGFRWTREIYPKINGWTETMFKEIMSNGSNLTDKVPKDVALFCPKFAELNKETRALFWIRLISLLASQESTYNTNAKHKEPDYVGPNVISSGLLQLSVESSLNRKFKCAEILGTTDTQNSLFDPQKNLRCGIRIMNYYVGTDGVISGYKSGWKGLAQYWAPFRHPNLKANPSAINSTADNRRGEWQVISRNRDKGISQKALTARQSGSAWDLEDWEFMHPSLTEDKNNDRDDHKMMALIRLANQTSFCF